MDVRGLWGAAVNKFLWQLFGIKEDEIPDPSRRGFLKMLGGAAIVGAAAPKYFFAPERGWNSGIVQPEFQFGFAGYKDLNVATFDHVIPMLVDNLFKTSPLLTRLVEAKPKLFHGSENAIQFQTMKG